MIHTYERLLIKLDRLVKKEKSMEEHFIQKDIEYQQAQQFYEKEAGDVARLEAQSFSSFLRSVIGTYDKKLDKEKQEEIQAKVLLDTASALVLEARENLLFIREQVADLKKELTHLREELRQTDTGFREKITEEERKRLEWNQEIEEVDEALAAGESVLNALDHVLASLESADSLASWDLFTDSVFVDMIKYNKIDEAEKELFYLEGLIASYQKELKDVNIQTALNYEKHSQMSRVFDIFFDNIFSDWNTKDKIQKNKDSLGRMESEVEGIQRSLIKQKNELIEKIQLSERHF